MIMHKNNLVFAALVVLLFSFEKKNLPVIVNNDYAGAEGMLQVVKTVAEFKKLNIKSDCLQIEGYYNAGDGGGGTYVYDANDITSEDNGGTILVSNNGRRFRLENWDGDIRKFGARINDVSNDSKAVENAIDAEGRAFIPQVGTHKALLATTIKINKAAKISGDGIITTQPGKQNIFQVASTVSFEADSINIDLPEGFDGDVIRTASSSTYTNAPVILKNIKGVTKGNGKLITAMERRTNITIEDCYWQGGAGMCLLRASRNAKVINNTVTASARGIVFWGGSFNTITGNTIKGEGTGKTGINFFSNRSASGADNLERGNLISENNINDVTEEGISFDCIGNDISRSPENAVAPIVTVNKLLASTKSQLNISINNVIALQGWANNYYAVILTGNSMGCMFAIKQSTYNTINLNRINADENYDIQQGDKILITTGAFQNKVIGNTIDNAGTHAIALYGSCWGNQIKNNKITNAKWRGISVVSVLGGPGNQHAYSGMNIIEKNVISMNYDPNNKKIPKLPGASICIESREYSKNVDYIIPRTFGNLVLNNNVSNMPISIIKSWGNNIIKNQVTNAAAGIELMNAANTINFSNVSNTGSVVQPLYKKDNVDATNQIAAAGNSSDFSGDKAGKKITVAFNAIAPSSSQTQYVSISDFKTSSANISVAPANELPDDCIYTSFVSSQNKIGIRIFNLSLNNTVSPGSLVFVVK